MIGSNQETASPTEAPRDAFRLSHEPPRVVRLSRKVLAILGVVGGLSVGGALIVALRSPEHRPATEAYATTSGAKASAIASAPKDYSQVPQLGAPLPGDLGKPILSAQQQGKSVQVPEQSYQAATPANDQAKVDRDRERQDLLAARASHLFLNGKAPDDGPVPTIESGQTMAFTAESPPEANQGAGMASPGNAAKLAFLNRSSDSRSMKVSAIEPLPSANIVQSGSIIPAALITGIRSDLPGQISAQVTQNVYDSPTGQTLLVPQGSRLIGEYDAQIDSGQTRLLMAWTRLILPDGRSVQLERQPGTDAAGFSGLQDRVDNHWRGVMRAAMISVLLGLGTELAAGNDTDIVRAFRRGTQDTVNQAGQQIVQRQLSISPTLTIRPGHPLRIMVTRDLILPPWGER